jgi:LPS-assembly protein
MEFFWKILSRLHVRFSPPQQEDEEGIGYEEEATGLPLFDYTPPPPPAFDGKRVSAFLALCGTLGAVCLFVLFPAFLTAQLDKPGKGGPYYLVADTLEYNEHNRTALATGNAELSDVDNVIRAQSLFYDESKDLVQAKDNVSLSQPDGSVMYAREAQMGSNFSQGYAKQVGMRLTDDSRLAAIQARRINGRYTLFDRGIFSPCAPCAENPREPPLWQVKARRVTHDQEKHDLIYRDASMDMWGVPMMYIPYFSMPDPTVKRRSGFLTPTLGRTENVGVFTTVPYYYTFSPDFDVTFRPTFSGTDGFRWNSTLRKRFEKGEIEFTNSLVLADRVDDDGTTKENQLRGHIAGFARFDINPFYRAGTEFALLSDKSYAQRYGESMEDILTSRVYGERLKGRDFGAAELFYFQNNRPGPQPEEPLVFPRLRYSALGEPAQTLGGRWSFDGMANHLMRDTGTSNRRLGLDVGWERRDVLPFGLVSTLTGHVRDDIFWVDNLPDPLNPSVVYDDEVTNRLFPSGQIALHYPLTKNFGSFSHIVEPIVSLTASRSLDRDPRLSNEDSLDVEFDATNLFDINRYPGTDRQEQGVRTAYGIRNAFYGENGGSAEIMLGQNYRLTPDPLFPTGTGLEERFSDYVGEVLLDPAEWLHFDYLFRLDKDGLDSRKHDVKTSFGVPEFRPYGNYTYLDQPTTVPSEVSKVEEISYGFTSNFTKYWTFQFEQTRDLRTNDGEALVTKTGLSYRDECFTAAVTLTRNFTERTDVPSGDTIFFHIYYKYLGGLDSGQ